MCVNFPGSPWGTTAPHTPDPATGEPYGSRYPWVTVEDMVQSQRLVADHLEITTWKAAVGSSLGGMEVLMWAALHPERLGGLISIAASAFVPVASVAWHLIGRKLIQSDPAFRDGDYYGSIDPMRGLQLARMVGHMTYLSNEALESKFGRRRRHGTRQFEVDSYLEHQGSKFARSYDANSYIRVQAAMDEMDLDEQFGSLPAAFARLRVQDAPGLVRHRLAVPDHRGPQAPRRDDHRRRPGHPPRSRHAERPRRVPDRLPPDDAAGPRLPREVEESEKGV